MWTGPRARMKVHGYLFQGAEPRLHQRRRHRDRQPDGCARALTVGPEVAYGFGLGDECVLELVVGLKGVWDFAKTTPPMLDPL